MVGIGKAIKKCRFPEDLKKGKGGKEVSFFAAAEKEIIEKRAGISYNRETVSLHNSTLSPVKN